MKFLNKILLICAVTLVMVGCEDYIGGDLNADPNNPTAVPVQAQIPSIQINLADSYGGDFSRFNSMLVQQTEGVARQWSSFNQYSGLTPNRFDDAWQNIYENVLNEIRIAKDNATADGSNHYLGILKIMEAFAWMTAADMWDNIPFNEALQGEANFSPAYDDQSTIINAAYTMIDEGITLLNGPAGAVSPGGEDVFYGGNTAAWVAAGNALKARGLLHDGDYPKAMDLAMNAFASAADNWGFQYPNANAAGQWYRFNRDRTGDLEFNPQFGAMLMETNDTNRMNLMNPIFTTDHPYMVADFFQELVTYREMQFIVAECAMRGGDNATAHAAYLNGIKASFDRLGAAGYDDYVAQSSVDPGAAGLTLEMIMKQKYVAMFLQPEAYSDWRRSGIPALSPTSGSSIPVRWDYSSTEYLFNSNSPAVGTVNIFTDKVGWNR